MARCRGGTGTQTGKSKITNTTAFDLTVEIRSADGKLTEFYQSDEERARKTLAHLAAPRLLSQPQLTLASEHGVSAIPSRMIDMILARTSTTAPLVLPLIFPAGLLDLVEVGQHRPEENSAAPEDSNNDNSGVLTSIRSTVEIHTLGGWMSKLKTQAMASRTVQDQRQSFAHFFDLPVIPFRLAEGGIGLINPANITRVSVNPPPKVLPETALRADLVRWRLRDAIGPNRESIITQTKSYWAGHPIEIKIAQTN